LGGEKFQLHRFGERVAAWLGDDDLYCFLEQDSRRLSVSRAGTAEAREVFAGSSPIRDLGRAGGRSGDVEFTSDGQVYQVSATGDVSPLDRSKLPTLLRAARWVGDEEVFELFAPNQRIVCSLSERKLRFQAADTRCDRYEITCGISESWELGRARWSPDSRKLATLKLDFAGVPKSPLTKWLQATVSIEWVPVTRTGEPYPRTSLVIADVDGRHIELDFDPSEAPIVIPVGWWADSSEFLLLHADRTMSWVRLLAVDPATGKTRLIITEQSDTFIEGLRLYQVAEEMIFEIDDGRRFLWLSAGDGWHRMWVADRSGAVAGCLTPPGLEVLQILRQSSDSRKVFFLAHERHRPYDTHLYSLDLRARDCTRITSSEGQHLVDISPTCEYFFDTSGSLTRDVETKLHRIGGTDIRPFTVIRDTADPSKFPDIKEVVTLAADRRTNLWGALVIPPSLPFNSRSFPVVDFIYNGPFITWAPRTRYESLNSFAALLAKAGIAVLMLDGRGTPERGKDFQDVAYRSFGAYEIYDHIAALDQLCKCYNFLDRARVGVCGGSWGGYMAIRAILRHPEVYKVAVATNPVHDLLDHPAAAIEPYMGLPEQNPVGYAQASNFPLVSTLQGRLLIIHGTADQNAPLSGTMKMVGELIRYKKEFDIKLFPDQGHQFTESVQSYWLEQQISYFRKYL
jgi:dipeptidyl aminopeptidase/acylaminoacyl peptidase